MSAKLNIIIITESIEVNDSSASKGRVALIQNLHKAGFQLKIYHYTRKPMALEGIACVAIKEQKGTLNYFLSKAQLLLKRFLGLNANQWVEKQFGFSFAFFNDSYSIKKALQKENPENFDWILTLSKAASFRPHKALLGLPQWHDKWLAYIHDPYPMHFYPRPYTWVEPGYYQKQEFFREVSKKAAFGVFPSKLLQEWMGSYYPDFLERGIVIPHQISENEIKTNSTLPTYFDAKKFTILHAGSLMKQRDPKGLVEGYALFLKKHPKAAAQTQLLFLGNNDYHAPYLNAQGAAIPSLYVSKGYVAYESVRAMQQEASVNVILEAKAEISPFLPGKFSHCIQVEKPILHLGPTLSETRRLLGNAYPYTAEIDAVQSIANHLHTLYDNWQQTKQQPPVAYADLKAYLGVNHLRDTLLNLT